MNRASQTRRQFNISRLHHRVHHGDDNHEFFNGGHDDDDDDDDNDEDEDDVAEHEEEDDDDDADAEQALHDNFEGLIQELLGHLNPEQRLIFDQLPNEVRIDALHQLRVQIFETTVFGHLTAPLPAAGPPNPQPANDAAAPIPPAPQDATFDPNSWDNPPQAALPPPVEENDWNAAPPSPPAGFGFTFSMPNAWNGESDEEDEENLSDDDSFYNPNDDWDDPEAAEDEAILAETDINPFRDIGFDARSPAYRNPLDDAPGTTSGAWAAAARRGEATSVPLRHRAFGFEVQNDSDASAMGDEKEVEERLGGRDEQGDGERDGFLRAGETRRTMLPGEWVDDEYL